MPSASPLLIVNPVAGGGRARRSFSWLLARLRDRPDVRLVVTERAGQAELMAAGAAAAGHDRVVAIGGDGTIQEVVNGILAGSAQASLGILPVGSGNDLARSLGIPRDRDAALAAALGPAERLVDLLHATNGDGRQRWFGSAGGIGFDAQVAAAMSTRKGWQSGQAGYLFTTLAELRRFTNRRVVLTLDDERSERSVLFVAIANGAYYGGGMHIAPGAAVDDGQFDLCIVGDVSRLTALRQLVNLYRGTHVRHPEVTLLRGTRLFIEADATTGVHLDGEPFGALPLRIELHPARLRVADRVPAD